MAMWKLDNEPEEYDLTPMIDIVFLLVAFFMMVAKLIDDSTIDIAVPIADNSKIPESSPHRIVVSIQETGDIYYGSLYMGKHREEAQTKLTPMMEEAREAKGDLLEVYIRADARAPHRYVRDVMMAIAAADVYDVKFAAFENP